MTRTTLAGSTAQAGRLKVKWAITQYRTCNILNKPVYTHTDIPIHWTSSQSASWEWTLPLESNGMSQCPYNLAASLSFAFNAHDYLLTANEHYAQIPTDQICKIINCEILFDYHFLLNFIYIYINIYIINENYHCTSLFLSPFSHTRAYTHIHEVG